MSHVTGATSFLLLVLACSPAPAPVASSLSDPSNPRAAEGVTPPVSSTTTTTTADVYVCPMHPEITSHQPGDCPKCHMKLVPKK